MIQFAKKVIKRLICLERARHAKFFLRDESRLWCAIGDSGDRRVRQEAFIVMMAHVIEKGLTMPNRHLSFGRSVLPSLMAEIEHYEREQKYRSKMVDWAIGVVKEYLELHRREAYDFSEDSNYWNLIIAFCARHPSIESFSQIHVTRDSFYRHNEDSFPQYALSRHTVRHYMDVAVPLEVIKAAVRLAQTTPSACNRQHVRVHCVADRHIAREICEIQGGSRGFGHLADKVLVVTSNLSVEIGARERWDPYVNGGMFLMNLCYALHYHRVAHCILTTGIDPIKIDKICSLAQVPRNEVPVGLLSCGIAPDEFDVASSPRKDLEEIFSVIGA